MGSWESQQPNLKPGKIGYISSSWLQNLDTILIIFLLYSLPGSHFGPRVLPRGSLVIPLSVVRPSVGRLLIVFFSNFLHEVSAPQGYKSDRARFLKKKSWGHKWGKTHFGGTFDLFCPYLCIQSLKVSEMSYTL